MNTKTPRLCGHCNTARSVRRGTRYGKQTNGEVRWLEPGEALAYLATLCRCPDKETAAETIGRTVVPEIRRDGQRILRPGVNVAVQLKQRLGTKVTEGHVIECYADGYLKVHLPPATSHLRGMTRVVFAGQWVKARQGTTTKETTR